MPPRNLVRLFSVLIVTLTVSPVRGGNILHLKPGDNYGGVVVGDAPFYEYQGVVGEGGQVTSVIAYGHSTVDLPFSTRAQGLSTYDYSTATTNSGYDYYDAHGHSSITVTGGGSAYGMAYDDATLRLVNAAANLMLYDRSTLYVEGTHHIPTIISYDHSHVFLKSGTVDDLIYRSHTGFVQDLTDFAGCQIYTILAEHGTSAVFTGEYAQSSVFVSRDTGSVSLYRLASGRTNLLSDGSQPFVVDQSKLDYTVLQGPGDFIVEGSQMSVLDVLGSGTLYFKSGHVGILGNGKGTVEWSGGLADEVFANSGLFRIFGTNLRLIDGFLSGRLADGSVLENVPVHQSSDSRIELIEANAVPEPATLTGALLTSLFAIVRVTGRRWFQKRNPQSLSD